MPKITDLITGLGPGWKAVGPATGSGTLAGTPIEEVTTIPNPAAANPLSDPATTAPTVTQGTGRYYVVVQDPEGHQRALYLKASPIKGGLSVPQTGITKPANEYRGDMTLLDWNQAGPVADVPAGAKEPSATANLDQVTDPKTGKVIGLRDPKTGTTIPVPADPAGSIHDVGNEVWLVKPDGSHTVVGSKPDKPTQINVAGVGLVDYDPTKPEGRRATVLIAAPKDPKDPVIEKRNGKTYVWNVESGQFVESNLPVETPDIGYTFNDPNSQWIIFYDKQGKEVSRTEKPGWKAPVQVQPGTAPAADLVAAKVPTLNPQTGALEFTDNQNQVKASAATEELAKQLGLKVASGSMSEKQAQDIITGAVNTMNALTAKQTADTATTQAKTAQDVAAANAAKTILDATQQGATTGAGLINQRVQAGQGMLASTLGLAGQRPMVGLPGNAGQMIMADIQGLTAQLGGGQDVYDTAARLVKAADPNGGQSPMAQQAFGVISQMLERYKQQTGQDNPAVTATKAAAASTASGGLAAPVTTAAPAATPTAQYMPWNNGFAAPGGAPQIAGATPFANAGTVYYGGGGLQPGQSGALPQPQFAAPITLPAAPPTLTPQMVLGR